MLRKSLSVVFGLSVLGLSAATAYAQGSPEVIVRQGDTIEWSAAGGVPHKVRFGANGATSMADINTILENFNQPLKPGDVPGSMDSDQSGSGKLLTAKVKDDAAPGKTFIFICGVHLGKMLSLPFRVEAKVAGEAPRTHRVIGEPGPNWRLHVDTKTTP